MHYDNMNLALEFFCACNNLPMPPQPPAVVFAPVPVIEEKASVHDSVTRDVVNGMGSFSDLDFFARLGEAVVDDINGVRKDIGLATIQQAAAQKFADRENGIFVKDVFKSPEEIMAVTRGMFRGRGGCGS